jgi:two-component system, cell cycle sensor histidine kinase and response regulator CckA
METPEKKEPLQILHLEDNALDAELIRSTLAEENIFCEIRRVETKSEFAAALEQGGWHLIISDFSLPTYDGLSALALAQQQAVGVPFIVFSGTIGEETAVECLKRGASDYVLKERPARLVSAMRQALKEIEERVRLKQAEDELRVSEEENKLLEAQCLRMQRMESIGALIAGMAHDLNNALVPILVGVDYLHSETLPPASLHMLATMRTSARRGADIIRQVLAFARGVESKEAGIRLSLLIREMEKIVQNIFPKSVQCKIKISDELWPVSGSATQLHQVLMNLSVNARDAMPQGGILAFSAQNLVLKGEEARVHTDSRPGAYVLISVSDTGTGIPPEIIEKIFQPFFTTKDPGKGTGLGLSTTLNIVKNHGGFVTVKSQVGQGTEFNVYLPAAISTAGTAEPALKAESLPLGRGELILVVDDESAICEITKVILENYNYRVLTAGSGPEAVAIFAEQRDVIQLVVTDTQMPFMDGRATCLALRKLDSKLKIITASGGHEKEGDTSLYCKTNAAIQKPYTVEKLLTTVHQVLTAA